MTTPHVPDTRLQLAESRTHTDHSLGEERESTDQALRATTAEREHAVDQKIEYTREKLDVAHDTSAKRAHDKAAETSPEAAQLEREVATIPKSDVRRVAERQVEDTQQLASDAVSAERAKATESVDTVSERAKQLLGSERERIDYLVHGERADAKRDFLKVLSREREETDTALELERDCVDRTVNSRDDALAMIAHDLRNYLNVIALKCELRAASPDEPGKSEKFATEIGTACRIMQHWASDLVDIACIEAGELNLDRQPVDPKDIIDNASTAFRVAASARGLKLVAHVPDERALISADRDRLAQVLNNLLDNALKFTSAPGTITMSFERLGEFIQFSVSDTGLGIDEAEVSKIFDRYWHAKSKSGGGLGLFISRRIIEAHGGEITVHSKSGHGTIFRFTIPMTERSRE